MQTARSPLSVLMTVYNGARFLREAIDSILHQTYDTFEFIIVNDGSQDETPRILKSITDPRVRVIETAHLGLTAALNQGLDACRGDLIARMDADDVAEPARFSTQVHILAGREDIGIVFSDILSIDERGSVTGSEVMRNVDNRILRDGLLFRRAMKPIVHPTVMMRRKVIQDLGGYRDFLNAEDHDFWLRCVDRFGMYRINAFLLRYRRHGGSVSTSKTARQAASGCMSAVNYLVRAAQGIDLFDECPELFAVLDEEAQRQLMASVAPAASDFARARAKLRSGRWVSASLGLATGIARHGAPFLPRLRNMAYRRIVEGLVAQAAERNSHRPRTAFDKRSRPECISS